MSKEKQIEEKAIEEMAKVIETTEQIARDAHCGLPSPTKDLYWHDYRKQSEVAKEVLFELKRQIHDKAEYPHAIEAYPFVSLKVFDAVLNNLLKKYEGRKNERLFKV